MVSTRLVAVTVYNKSRAGKKKTKKKQQPISHHAKDRSDYGPAPFHPWVWSVANHVLDAVVEIVHSCPPKNGKTQQSEEQFQPRLSEKHNSIDLHKVLSTNRSHVIVSPGLTHICLGRICRNMAPYLVCPCIIYSVLYKQSQPFQLLTL